jgi:hypothetical protein
MDMEMKQVKKSDFLLQPRHKEWLYTSVYDKALDVYISFVFIRIPLADQLTLIVFDPEEKEPFVFRNMMVLDKVQAEGKLDLVFGKKNINARYFGSGEEGWEFRLSGDGVSVQLKFKPAALCFTEVYPMKRSKYSLLQYFQNDVSGTVVVPGCSYTLEHASGIYDRCFGIVPRKTGWHWLAVQNEDIAITAWFHDWEDSPDYSHVLVRKADGMREWVELCAAVTFARDSGKNRWHVSAEDLDLDVEILMTSPFRQEMPPLIPFFINLQHDDHFVRATGRVLVEGVWIHCGAMHGVLEEHKGIW